MIRYLRILPNHWLYFGEETEVEPPFGAVEPFFFIEDAGDFLIGNGWRVKETPTTAWHIGIAKRSLVRTHEAALGGRQLEDFTPEEIGGWDGSVSQTAEAA